MYNKNKKRGFTIVELVIVIAVIAILAAVLIPTFASLVKKANRSADIQAVRQMNTLLQAEDANKPENLSEAKTILLDANIKMENYTPLTKDMYFYWVKSINRVVYANADNKVEFPEEYADLAYKAGDWFSLSYATTESDEWKDAIATDTTTGKVVASVADGAEFANFMKAYVDADAKAKDVDVVKFTGDVDLMGSAANFSKIQGTELVIDADGHKLYGLNSNESATNGANAAGNASSYAYGLFGSIKSGQTVTLKNVVISGAVIDDPENPAQVGHAGVIAGSVNGTLILENVTVENCYVRGEKKVGALVGYVHGNANITMTDVTVKNVEVTGAREVAALFGYVQKYTTFDIDVTKENVTVTTDTSYGYQYNDDGTTVAGVVEAASKAGVTSKDYWDVVGKTSATAVAKDFE